MRLFDEACIVIWELILLRMFVPYTETYFSKMFVNVMFALRVAWIFSGDLYVLAEG